MEDEAVALLLAILAEHVEEVLHVGGEGGFEFDARAGGGVGEFEGAGVQGDPADHGLLDGRLGVG